MAGGRGLPPDLRAWCQQLGLGRPPALPVAHGVLDGLGRVSCVSPQARLLLHLAHGGTAVREAERFGIGSASWCRAIHRGLGGGGCVGGRGRAWHCADAEGHVSVVEELPSSLGPASPSQLLI
jgi:hypothetical protein